MLSRDLFDPRIVVDFAAVATAAVLLGLPAVSLVGYVFALVG